MKKKLIWIMFVIVSIVLVGFLFWSHISSSIALMLVKQNCNEACMIVPKVKDLLKTDKQANYENIVYKNIG